MSEQTTTPAPSGAPAPPPPPPDVSQQIAQLTDAVNRLVAAQQHAPTAPSPVPSSDIGGELPGGAPLLPAVDVARLSPVQQIALGLRDAKPVGPAHPAVLHAERRAGARPNTEAPPVGAD